jgi:hypothetical protein
MKMGLVEVEAKAEATFLEFAKSRFVSLAAEMFAARNWRHEGGSTVLYCTVAK